MDRQLEADLSEAFSRHASGIPVEARARLCQINYRPRTNRVSPRLTVGSAAVAAATTGVVVSVVVLGGAQAAFAGWSASPTPASSGQAATAAAHCQAELAAAPALPGSTDATGWSPVATDVRGPFSVVIYQDGPTDATCFTGPSLTVVSRSDGRGGSMTVSGHGSKTPGGTGSSSLMVSRRQSGEIEQVSVAHLDSTSDGPYTLVEGQVETGVTGVSLVRSDGQDIQASTGSGWFVAWWPGSQDATSAQITTATGTTTQTLDTAPPPPPPGSACAVNPQTTSSTLYCTGGDGTGGPTAGIVHDGGDTPSVNTTG